MKTLTSIGLAAALTISLSTAVSATPTLLGTTTDPTGINDLVVDGTTYDVTFSTTTPNSFTQGTTLSTDSADALASALNTLGVTELNATSINGYLVVVDSNISSTDGAFAFRSTPWFGTTDVGLSLGLNTAPPPGTYVEAADFRAVPEPLTLGLFVTGLVALFMLRRRVNRAAS